VRYFVFFVIDLESRRVEIAERCLDESDGPKPD